MINLKSRLTIKICFTTAILLIASSVVTLWILSIVLPRNYAYDLSEDLGQKTEQLLIELQTLNLEDGLLHIQKFAIQNNVSIEISQQSLNEDQIITFNYTFNNPEDANSNVVITSDGNIGSAKSENDGILVEDYFDSQIVTDEESILNMDGEYNALSENAYSAVEDASIATAKEYSVVFSDRDEEYKMMIVATLEEIDQTMKALKNAIPSVLIGIIFISFLGGTFYSSFLTKPILKLNSASKQLANLDFDICCDNKRKDELGELSKNMDNMAKQLKANLIDLKDANNKLQEDINLERELKEKQLSFFASVSHELKTPITIIKGQLEGMIYEVGPYKDYKKYLNRSLEITTQMQDLVQEILVSSKLDFSLSNTESALTLEDIPLVPFIDYHIEHIKGLLSPKNISITTDVDESISILADKSLLSQVMSNTLSNAIFYTPSHGEVLIKTTAIENQTLFTIENTGVFLKDEEIPKLFDAFYRVEKSRNKESGGSGLGLYIVQKILELHNFDHGIKNSERGVLFWITFPCVLPET